MKTKILIVKRTTIWENKITKTRQWSDRDIPKQQKLLIDNFFFQQMKLLLWQLLNYSVCFKSSVFYE